MKRAFLLFALFLAAGPLTAQEDAAPRVAVTYTLDATQPKSGTVKVEMLVENNRDDEVTLAWVAPVDGRLGNHGVSRYRLDR